MKLIVLSIFIFLSLIIYSCSSSRKVDNVEVSYDKILESMKKNYEMINSYSAKGNIDLSLKSVNMSIKFDMQVLKPFNAIIDLYGPLNFNLGSVLLRRDSIFFYNELNNQLIKSTISSIINKNSDSKEIINNLIYPALFGYLNPELINSDSSLTTFTKDEICISKISHDYRYDIYFDKRTSYLSEIVYNNNSMKETIKIKFQNLKRKNGIIFPMEIVFNNLSGNETISIVIDRIEFNNVQGELKLILPEDVEVKEW